VLADRIEREIEIDAPIDVVWTVITEPEHITGWFTDTAEIDVSPGSEGRFVWDQKARSRKTTVNVRVERLEPPHVFSFRWGYPDGAEPDEATAPLVEFTLEQRGDVTHVRLVESGLEKLSRSEEERELYYSEHSSGWTLIVERLRGYAADQRSAVAG
jgi:uncharacterized protein YndB with AHSA1/START domain